MANDAVESMTNVCDTAVKKQMKVLLICSTSVQIITFRESLIEKLQSENCEVFTIAFDDDKRETIESRGIKHFCVDGANRSLNPIKTLGLTKSYLRIIKQINPDIVFTFMLKPNIFGTRAAKRAGVKKIFAMVEGAGDVFVNDGLKWNVIRRVVCGMYRKSFKIPSTVFFLNHDDINEFIARKLVKSDKCEIIPGIGVDTNKFEFAPVENRRTFLMIARMLKTKGVVEYCKAARLVKQKYPDAEFNYLGGEGSVKLRDIQEYTEDGSVNYLGTTDDVRPYLKQCTAFVLPTYREGMPVAVMEAMATGRAVIASDVSGCHEAVEDGQSGWLTPSRDVDALVEKITWCIEHPEGAEAFGTYGRKIAEERFNQDVINTAICDIVLK